MDMIKSILEEELDSALELMKHYQNHLNSLPKGSLSAKKIKGNKYIYLQYREGNKIVGRVLHGDEIQGYRDKIEKRNKYKRLLKDVGGKVRYLRRALNVK